MKRAPRSAAGRSLRRMFNQLTRLIQGNRRITYVELDRKLGVTGSAAMQTVIHDHLSLREVVRDGCRATCPAASRVLRAPLVYGILKGNHVLPKLGNGGERFSTKIRKYGQLMSNDRERAGRRGRGGCRRAPAQCCGFSGEWSSRRATAICAEISAIY
ncbi:hypothetical protein EVAR_85549_1 [Eumeta japonica]|uniref:Uncharacterized protein n=1 Tax=Eumeta variegata TaxID=151549 RepID=A0A4C1VCP3_EUMVA|nr:hypothetical protein EVAR_85549_1 [Eumeta japonica]